MGVSLRIVEGQTGAPPDLSRVVATIGWSPLLSVAQSEAEDTEVAQIDSLTGLEDITGYGIGPEAAARRRRISGIRGLLVPHNASTAGVVGPVAQTGLGPSVSVAANDTHPSDDATVIVKIVDAGAPGAATYQVSVGFNVIGQGNTPRLYGPVLSMPARLAASVIGTVDLTTIAYALPAIVTGTADMSDPTLYGSGGSLAGKTLIAGADIGGSQTATFGTGTSAPADADDVVTTLSALTNVTASLYSSRNLLKVSSDTLGAPSTLAITGGTGLALLGLVTSVSPAEGAEPTHEIEHLGIVCTFAAGTYRSGTTYAFAVTSPRPSVAEVEARLEELDAAGAEFGVVHIAAPLNASDALAMAGALDALGAEWEARTGNPRAVRFVIGVDPSETDTVVKATFATFRSRRVDIAARGAYVSAGLFSGGARVLRSQSWPCADADALLEYHQDRGERRLEVLRQGFPEVYSITADENTATVRLVNATGMRFNVMVIGSPGLQFSGGYSSADATSAFTDASVRNTTLRAFTVGYAALAANENRTDLDTNSDGTLTEASADRVAVDVADAIAAAIVPGGATAVQCTVDTSTNFYTTRQLSGSIKFQDRKPARDISFTIGPGLIAEG